LSRRKNCNGSSNRAKTQAAAYGITKSNEVRTHWSQTNSKTPVARMSLNPRRMDRPMALATIFSASSVSSSTRSAFANEGHKSTSKERHLWSQSLGTHHRCVFLRCTPSRKAKAAAPAPPSSTDWLSVDSSPKASVPSGLVAGSRPRSSVLETAEASTASSSASTSSNGLANQYTSEGKGPPDSRAFASKNEKDERATHNLSPSVSESTFTQKAVMSASCGDLTDQSPLDSRNSRSTLTSVSLRAHNRSLKACGRALPTNARSAPGASSPGRLSSKPMIAPDASLSQAST